MIKSFAWFKNSKLNWINPCCITILVFLMRRVIWFPSLSQDFEWKSQLKKASIYKVLTMQCLKKYFPYLMTVLNSFGLLKGHCLEAIVSILSWYVETMECYCTVYRVILKVSIIFTNNVVSVTHMGQANWRVKLSLCEIGMAFTCKFFDKV